ncbi:MAG: hypothetical protein U0992_04455 [Planctomycetaceae bacterium]
MIPAYNEEVEPLPTLVSLTCLRVPDGGARLSSPTTQHRPHGGHHQELYAKYVWCETPGVGYRWQAAYNAIAPTAEYAWLTDADSRVIRPVRTLTISPASPRSWRRTSIFDTNEIVIGISTGRRPRRGSLAYMSSAAAVDRVRPVQMLQLLGRLQPVRASPSSTRSAASIPRSSLAMTISVIT